MIILSFFLAVGAASLFIFNQGYLAELIMSFLPYIGLLLFFILVYWIVYLWKRVYNYSSQYTLKEKISPLFVLIFALLFGWASHFLLGFYNQKILSDQPLQHPLKVLFSNIYKDNLNFEDIQKKIKAENPDLVIFVEFSNPHKEGLKDFFDQYYPYVNISTWSKNIAGSVVFSKYPLEDLTKKISQGGWRYRYVKVDKDGVPYYFYVVHTTSPVSKTFFEKRNEQLKKLQSDFLNIHLKEREENAKVIMVGDFNVSPWSSYYQSFAQELSPTMENITRGNPMLFTWSLSEMLKVHQDFTFLPLWIRKIFSFSPIIWSHIDHAFVSPSVKVDNFKMLWFKGSDHRGFVFDAE